MDNVFKERVMNHYTGKAPDQWSSIKKQIANDLVTNLLKSLEELSDPHGKELIDFRNEYLSKIDKHNRIGA